MRRLRIWGVSMGIIPVMSTIILRIPLTVVIHDEPCSIKFYSSYYLRRANRRSHMWHSVTPKIVDQHLFSRQWEKVRTFCIFIEKLYVNEGRLNKRKNRRLCLELVGQKYFWQDDNSTIFRTNKQEIILQNVHADQSGKTDYYQHPRIVEVL